MRVILASKSPRRKELLKEIFQDFIIIPSNVDENKYSLDKLSFVKAEEISLEKAINLFDKGVNEASTCEQLIRACATCDSNIKKLSQKDSSIKVTDIEKREDVKSIRRLSEEKSLKLCQTQQMR